MFIKFVLTYWKQIALVFVLAIQSLSIWYYKNKYELSQKDYEYSQLALKSLGDIIANNKTDREKNIEISKNKSIVLKTIHKTKTQHIDREVENNATYQDAINILDNYQY